uniref:Uncharacterized protein n=1 Tax=Oncorhynchus tshawytscha TaxID=74940 RepID=A0A8C8M4X0_ONCTS
MELAHVLLFKINFTFISFPKCHGFGNPQCCRTQNLLQNDIWDLHLLDSCFCLLGVYWGRHRARTNHLEGHLNSIGWLKLDYGKSIILCHTDTLIHL